MVVRAKPPLSRRESQVAELAAVGQSTSEIANLLVVSPETIKTHLRNIFRKCQVHNRAELAAWRYGRSTLTGAMRGDTDNRGGQTTSKALHWNRAVPRMALAAIIAVMTLTPVASASNLEMIITPDIAESAESARTRWPDQGLEPHFEGNGVTLSNGEALKN